MITHLQKIINGTSLPTQPITPSEKRKDPLITAIFLLSKPMDYHYLVKNEEKKPLAIVASYVYPITKRDNLERIQIFFENFARKYPNDFGFFKSPPDPKKNGIYSRFKSFLNGKERFIDELLEKVLAKKAEKSSQNRYVELENLTPQDFSKFIHRFCADNFLIFHEDREVKAIIKFARG